jgi:hypothetical protein
MPRKLALICVVITLISVSAFSQAKIGIRGGLNFNLPRDYTFSQSGYNYELTIQNTLRTGFHFGLVSQVKLLGVLIRPEILFTSVNNNIQYKETMTGENHLVNQEFNRLDIPVMALLRIKSLRLGFGPVGSVLLKEKSIIFDEIGYEQKYNIASLGYQSGLGIEIGKMIFDVKYEGSLSRFGNGLEIGDNTFGYNPRSSQFIVSMGIFF